MRQVVIIGGGFVGAYCAKKLQRHFSVTLIDTKDYYEFTPSILRTITEPQHLSKIERAHRSYLHSANIVRGNVSKITRTEVTVGKEIIPFDFLIIGSGSRYESPIKEQGVVMATRGKILQESHEHLSQAHTILIIGGGIVGVELAAEIADHYPEKKITLIQAGKELMERMPEKARIYAENYLTKKGVTIIKNERVVEKKKNTYITSNGNVILAEMAFVCTGITPNSEFIKKSMPTLLDEKGFIKVNETLNLEDHEHIFVGGDVTNIKEEKTAQNAEAHAHLITRNLLAIEYDRKTRTYQSKPRVMVISLGKKRGILTYKNFVLTGFIPSILKSIVEKKTMMRY